MTNEEIFEWFDKVSDFHQKRAPGLVIGVAMVAASRERLGKVKDKVNAVCETNFCLGDVIQVMTGCTLGNRYLETYEGLGRYSLTLYDRADGRGVRASIDIGKISESETPELYKFFRRTRAPELKTDAKARQKSGQLIVEEFMSIRDQIIKLEDVQMKKFGKSDILPAARCKSCHESFLQSRSEDECSSCSGEHSYYRPIS